MCGSRRFILRNAVEERLELLMNFHKANLTEYLWPRSMDQFRELVLTDSLMEVVELRSANLIDFLLGHATEEIVGLAYVMVGNEPNSAQERTEFGGIFIAENRRGFGLATALGIVSISNHFALDPPVGRMVAHVHEFNELPRDVLQNHLGFHKVGQEIPPNDVAPPSMTRNERGEVVGDVFQFDQAILRSFADWIEGFRGIVTGKRGRARLDVLVPSLTTRKAETLEALRDLGNAAPARNNATGT